MPGKGIKVLIVEDHDDLRRSLCDLLGYVLHYTVLEAGTVEEARRIVASDSPDAILLDLMLPGESGVVLLRELKQSGSPVRVVVATAAPDDGQDDSLVAQARALKPYRVLFKPVTIVALNAALLPPGRDTRTRGEGR